MAGMRKVLAVLVVSGGCSSNAAISADPSVGPTPAPEPTVVPNPVVVNDSGPQTTSPGADPPQYEVREVQCDGTISNPAGSVSWRIAEATYPGLTKSQILDSVHVLVPSASYVGYTDIPSVLSGVRDGATFYNCGAASAPTHTKVTFVRRM